MEFKTISVFRKLRRIIAAALLGAGASGGIAEAEARAPSKGSAPAIRPGTLIDTQPIRLVPEGARAYRVLYRSTGVRGEPVDVSGVIIIPSGPAPEGGRPIIAWAHPTTGIVDRCAPSESLTLFPSIQGLGKMLRRGFIVAATDYEGLGTPGLHPYLVGDSEAHSVIDSVRAAIQLAGPGGARSEYAVWGHSQGGHAALFTGMIARRYAPELTLVGVAAAAPATELATLLVADLDTSGGRNIAAMTLWSWARVYGAPMSKGVVPAAIATVNDLADECLQTLADVMRRAAPIRALERRFLTSKDFASYEPWKSLLARNTPGTLPPDLPVFLAQGGADELVLPRVTDYYRNRLCEAGSPVAFELVPGAGHMLIARDTAPIAIQWIRDRFAGEPAPSNCGRDPVD